MIYSTSISCISPVVVCLSVSVGMYDIGVYVGMHIKHLTFCCVMLSILSDFNSIPSIWPGLGWIWCDPTSVWLFLPVLDWFHLIMIYSASISRMWPVAVWCDLYSMILTVFHLFGLVMIDSKCSGVTQPVFDWFYLYWTDSTRSWSIRPPYPAFDLLLCDVIYIKWL